MTFRQGLRQKLPLTWSLTAPISVFWAGTHTFLSTSFSAALVAACATTRPFGSTDIEGYGRIRHSWDQFDGSPGKPGSSSSFTLRFAAFAGHV